VKKFSVSSEKGGLPMVEHTIETDVLVIGGGMAGCFTAVKAKDARAMATGNV
jgi:glycerol-3-phosphate dehydrogenase